jgi:hypothetical protein
MSELHWDVSRINPNAVPVIAAEHHLVMSPDGRELVGRELSGVPLLD